MRKKEIFYRKCDFCHTDIHYGQSILSIDVLHVSYDSIVTQDKCNNTKFGILCSKCGECIKDTKLLRKAIGVSEPAPEHVGNCCSSKQEELGLILDTCGECGTVIGVNDAQISIESSIWKTEWNPVFGGLWNIVGRETIVSYCSGCGPKMVDESRLIPLIVKLLRRARK